MINFFFFLLLFFGVSDNFTLSPLGVPPAVRWNLKGLTAKEDVLTNQYVIQFMIVLRNSYLINN